MGNLVILTHLVSIFLLSNAFASLNVKEEKQIIGRYKSRAILRLVSETEKKPIVILIPGSGAHGPEEMMPPSITLDGKEHSLFRQISEALNQGGVNTLSLGKPGVEFFSGWDKSKWFYDLDLYKFLHWQDLINNVQYAVDYALSLPTTEPSRVFILGHSEGAQVSVDYAATDNRVKGIILLGYLGTDLASILDWQLFRREIEFFVATDVDQNKDGFVDRIEAKNSPEFHWQWKQDQEKVSYAEIELALRADENRKSIFSIAENSPLYTNGIFRRGEINSKAASLSQDIYVFTGALDMQTPAREALTLQNKCIQKGKADCFISIVPGLGHGFSAPRPPRSQPVIDLTVGPVDPGFQETLLNFALMNLAH